MRAALLLVTTALAFAPAIAHADDTFEAKAAAAHRVTALDDLVWTLTAACDKGDDVQQRQCRHVRDAHAAELGGGALLVDADPDAFSVGAWNAAKKSVAIALSGCVRCGGVKLDGKRWVIVGGKPATVSADGIAHAEPIYEGAKTFADAAAAKRYADALAHVRVQLLVQATPGGKAGWHAGTTDGVSLAVVGYLVSNPCDGAVVIANPPAQRGTVDAHVRGGRRQAGCAGCELNAGQRREIVVELEQHVDLDADELHAEPGIRAAARPPHDRRQREHLIRRRQRQLDGDRRADRRQGRRRDERATDADVARLGGDPCRRVARRAEPHRQDPPGARLAAEVVPAFVTRILHARDNDTLGGRSGRKLRGHERR